MKTETDKVTTTRSPWAGALTSVRAAPARTVDLSDGVYHKLFAKISSGEYSQHQRLPSETSMAEEYGVSRPTVRTALKRLRDDGLVYSRQGSGSYVRIDSNEPAAGFGPVGTIADIQRCYEVRISFERDAAYFAALRANAEAIAEIRASADKLEAAAKSQDYEGDADFQFHLAIARASNNRYYVQMLTALKEHVQVGMRVGGTCLTGPGRAIDFVVAEHRAIVDAIASKNPLAAQKAMDAHISSARSRVFEGKLLDLSL